MKNIFTGIGVVLVYIFAFIVSIAVPILIVALGISLYNSWQEPDTEPTLNTRTDYLPESDTLPKQDKQDFINGCSPDGQDMAYCNCAFNYLDSRLTNKEFVDMANNIDANNLPDIFVDAVENCVSKL